MTSWKRDASGRANRSAAVARWRASADRLISEILSGSIACGQRASGKRLVGSGPTGMAGFSGRGVRRSGLIRRVPAGDQSFFERVQVGHRPLVEREVEDARVLGDARRLRRFG